ncbi:MAG: Ig-like domain-containing protein, partial [Euryarchaeota archaeon]|nr:Ig-like domain-containing protein [Euryarchaeota archaeon]
TDTASPWSWSFAPAANGYYQFYSRANDTAGNYEATNSSWDAWCAYDNVLPYLASSNPTDGAIGIGTGAGSVICVFSEPMNQAYTGFTTNLPGAGGAWSPNGTVFTVTYGALAASTVYWIQFAGQNHRDLAGNLLNTGLNTDVNFTTAGGAGVATVADNLWVERSSPNIILHWTNVTDSTNWHVYCSNNRLAAFPGGWTMKTIAGTNRTDTMTGQCTDGLTWYYIVRGFDGTATESKNSTMGVKTQLSFTLNAAPSTNNMYFSLPYNCQYKKASDIVKDIEGGDGVNSPSTVISLIGQWSQAGQSGVTYFYEPSFLDWEGTDFAIAPGDGLYFGIISTFNWVVNGTDKASQLTFTLNAAPATNNMYISLPYTSNYTKASDIVKAIEGGDGVNSPSTKIALIGLWSQAGQSGVTYFYEPSFLDWEGTDFAIAPGDGIYLGIIASFTWTPEILTPAVP